MAAESPGARIASKESSELYISPLEDQGTIQSLASLCNLFITCIGSHGCGKLIHNHCGGQVTITSDCSRLLESLSLSKPVIKLVILPIKDHVRLYSDAGLLVGIFSLTLIMDALRLDIHRRLVTDVYDIALKVCIDIIEADWFSLKLRVSPNDDVMLMNLISSMYLSKSSCLLFDNDLAHICHLTLDGYRKNKDGNPSPGCSTSLVYITLDGQPPSQSKLLPGVIYDSPSIPTYRHTPLQLKLNENNLISIALVETSLSGDSESFLDVTYELTHDIDMSATVLTQLEQFTVAAVDAGVGMVICQKVVHPKLKKFLKQQGVLVLDRLGRVLFEAVHKLSGGVVVDPFSSSTRWRFTSILSDVCHLVINKKSYVHMENSTHCDNLTATEPTSRVYTVMLCHRSDQALQELKTVYERCQQVLGLTIKAQLTLCGGGCWQSAVCIHLNRMIPDLVNQWAQRLGCSKLQLTHVLQTFSSALAKTAISLNHKEPSSNLVDLQTGHRFLSDLVGDVKDELVCQCGTVLYHTKDKLDYAYLGQSGLGQEHSGTKQGQDDNVKGQGYESSYSSSQGQRSSIDMVDRNAGSLTSGEVQGSNMFETRVLDAYLPVISALKTSVAVSCLVLGIHNYVQDVN